MAHKYLITLSWIVETDEDLSPGTPEADAAILDIVQRKDYGKASCSTCPARFPANCTIERLQASDERSAYMSPDRFVEDSPAS
jgi:hypothetical protein